MPPGYSSGGHYETRVRILRNGRKTTYKVWVPNPKPKYKKPVSSTKKTAASLRAEYERRQRIKLSVSIAKKRSEALRLRSQKLATRKLYLDRVAAARRSSYEALRKRQSDLIRRTGIVKSIASRNIDRADTSVYKPPTASRDVTRKRPKPLAPMKPHVWTTKELESYIENQKKIASSGGSPDRKSIEIIEKKYREAALSVNARQRVLVKKINDYLKAGNIKAAIKLYRGAYKTNTSEFNRLNGTGKDALKQGTVNQFYSSLNEISVRQREWWKKQMKSSLQSQINDIARHGNRSPELSKILQEQLGYFEGTKLPRVLDHTEVVIVDGKKKTRDVYREQTLEEALDSQEARLIMEREKIRAKFERDQISAQVDASRHRLVRSPITGDFVKYDTANVQAYAQKVIHQQMGNVPPKLTKPQDVTEFADTLVKRWVYDHPQPAFSYVNPKYATDEQREALRKWEAARSKFEDSVFSVFGMGVPKWWDRTFQLPGISGALQVLQAPIGAIGSGARVGLAALNNAFLPGSEGESQFYLGAQLEDAPYEIRAKVKRLGFLGGKKFFTEWRETPEGKAWQKQMHDEWRARVHEENVAFSQGFAGENDIGGKLESLNTFGSRPTSDELSNLMFQLLADPTNAIPLKFTTYMARGKYALDAAAAAKAAGKGIISRTHGVIRDFSSVDEATLRASKEFKVVSDEAARLGMTDEELIRRMEADVAGITEKSDLDVAVKAWAERTGLDMKKVSPAAISNLAEWMATKMAGPDLFTQQKKIAAEISAAQKAERAARAAAKRRIKAAEERGQRGQKNKIEAGRAAAERLAIVHESQVGVAVRRSVRPTVKPVAPEVPTPPKPKAKPVAPVVVSIAEETKKVEAYLKPQIVRKVSKHFDASSQYYVRDIFDDLRPIETGRLRGPKWAELNRRAREGDQEALAYVREGNRRERIRFRVTEQDKPTGSTFSATAADVAESAGHLGDAARTKLFNETRLAFRKAVRVAAKNPAESADDFVRGFTADMTGRIRAGDRVVAEGKLDFMEDALDEYLFGAGSRIDIGHDIINARDNSFRGLKGLYQPFTHHDLLHYKGHELGIYKDLSNPKFVQKLTYGNMYEIMNSFESGLFGEGAAGFRDGGQVLFEIFHQLRLVAQVAPVKSLVTKRVRGAVAQARAIESIEKFTLLAHDLIKTNPDALSPWMWMVMLDRSGLNIEGMFSHTFIEDGFRQAAEAFGLHPDLALSSVPYGYFAKPPPRNFGLKPILHAIYDTADFTPAPMDWTYNKAAQAVTDIFQRGSGIPSQVLHYTAGRWGDIIKGTPIRNRIMDEMTHLLVRESHDVKRAARVLAQYEDELQDVLGVASRREVPESLEDAVAGIIEREQNRIRAIGSGRTVRKHADYAPLRAAIEAAYWDGKLAFRNPKIHELMYLQAMQTWPEKYLQFTRRYHSYMQHIGESAMARNLIYSLHKIEIDQAAANLAHIRAGKVGEPGETVGNASVWRLMGFMPSDTRIDAWGKRTSKYADEAERDYAKQLEREEWSLTERNREGNALVGTSSLPEFHDDLVRNIDTFKSSDGPARKAAARSIRSQLQFLAVRIMEGKGARLTVEEWEEVTKIGQTLWNLPEGQSLLDEARETFGNSALAARLDVADEVIAWQAAFLEIQLRSISLPGGGIKPGFETKFRRLDAERLKINEMRSRGGSSPEFKKMMDEIADASQHDRPIDYSKFEDMRAKITASYDREASEAVSPSVPAPEIPVPPPVHEVDPEIAVNRSISEELLERITHMSEEEWWDWEAARAARILQGKTASAARKNAARQRLKDIAMAKEVRRIERGRGTDVTVKMRRTSADRVLKRFAKLAEEYISPKMISPYIKSASDSAVEKVRTYYVFLRSAAETPVASSVRKLGPKYDLDYFPEALFNQVHAEVTAAINAARGFTAETVTGARHAGKRIYASGAAGRIFDTDPRVLKAKAQVLAKHGIYVDAYDETLKVLRKGYVQDRTAKYLLAEAGKISSRFGGDTDDIFLRLRQKKAKHEARLQLAGLAYGEMFGHTPQTIFDEFVARYSDDATLKKFTPELSSFQKKTLQEHIKSISGISDLNEPGALANYLQSANLPPFHRGESATRDYLVKTGQWTPRTARDFATGHRSWSVWEESDYWISHYGMTPEWTDPKRLALDFNEIFHSDEAFLTQSRKWGAFDSAAAIRMKLEGISAKQIEDEYFAGTNPSLGQRRERALQRRYYIERYGEFVSKDGVHFDTMPWLMDPDELLLYMSRRGAEGLPPAFVETPEELAEILSVIQKHLEPLFKKQIGTKLSGGVQPTYEDIFRVSADTLAEVLANPQWAKRWRDVVGHSVDAQAAFTRYLIFTNPAFLTMNVIDVGIKGLWYRMNHAQMFNPAIAVANPRWAEGAKKMSLTNLGIDLDTSLFRFSDRRAVERIKNPVGGMGLGKLGRAESGPLEFTGAVLDFIHGFADLAPELAGRAEQSGKLWLARGMYPSVMDLAIKQFPNEAVAHAAAMRFISKEIKKMWPTAASGGVIEHLFNRFVPFSSYSLRNKVLFISEVLAHPRILNEIEYIGRYIEQQNLKNWNADPNRKDQEMPEYLRKRIELPWAPGYYLDLGQFSDFTRGGKPFYALGNDTTPLDFISQWVRLVNPSNQAGIYALMNAFGAFQTIQYIPVLDANGFPTGEYTTVLSPLTEPWSQNAPTVGSVFWVAEAIEQAQKLGVDGSFTAGDMSIMLGQVGFFGAISTYDRGSAYRAFYRTLLARDPEAANKWLEESAAGQYLRDWWDSKGPVPLSFKDSLSHDFKTANDEFRFFHSQTPDWQQTVKDANAEIKRISDSYAAQLILVHPESPEYKRLRGEMFFKINQVYLQNPELMESEIWNKSPLEWSRQLSDWQTDKLMDDFFELEKQRPKRASYASSKLWQEANTAWLQQKAMFLTTYPQVRAGLAENQTTFAATRDAVHAEWDQTMARIEKRNDAIEKAKAIIDKAGRDSKAGKNAQDRLDILYLSNDLDFSLLEADTVASYFDYNDFTHLPKGVAGPLNLRGDFPKLFNVVYDFGRVQYEKAKREGTLDEYFAGQKYGQETKKAVLYAKGGDVFGEFSLSRWQKYLNDHPDFRAKEFSGVSGKEQVFRENIAYIEGIRSAFSEATKNGKFDAGAFVRAMKSRPKVLAEYFRRHKGKEAEWAKNDLYIRHISVWGKLIRASKFDQAADAWNALPQWVKNRYLDKHPDSGMKNFNDRSDRRASSVKTSQYLGYMKKWVGLFDTGKKGEAMSFFKTLPSWVKERYFDKHPENRVRFEDDVKMISKLGDYFASSKEGQTQYLKDNPDLARWLARNVSSKETQRQAVLLAYGNLESPWLKRVFREKFPEFFSKEAAGERKLRAVFGTLSSHPDMLPGFEQWVETIWGTYTEMLKHPPRPVNSYFTSDHSNLGRHVTLSLSAAEAQRRRRAKSRPRQPQSISASHASG